MVRVIHCSILGNSTKEQDTVSAFKKHVACQERINCDSVNSEEERQQPTFMDHLYLLGTFWVLDNSVKSSFLPLH